MLVSQARHVHGEERVPARVSCIYAYACAKFLIKCVGVLQFYGCGFLGVRYLKHRSEATLKVTLGV